MKEKILSLLSKVKREGMDKLIGYLESSDFFDAPASTKFHLCVPGGLAKHSYNVYECLKKKAAEPFWKETLKDVSEETIILVSILHDLCKTNFYKQDWKNQKTYDPQKVAAAPRNQVKQDNAGSFIWETVPTYVIEDKIPYGHGEKSVMMIEHYIKLLPAEKYAIRWHMGYSEPKENWAALNLAFDMYPLALALHEADQEATHILEKDVNL